jgi:uncharacterized protein YciI
MTRYAYVYDMAGDPELIRATAPHHTDYWRSLALPGYAGGPFADRSGGLITFLADDEGEARQAVAGDPFTRAAVIGESRLKAWQPIGADEPLTPVLHAHSR